MNRDEHPVEGLSAYLDGALEPDERREIEAHLAACASCSRLLEDLRILAGDLREERIPDVPSGLEAKISRALGDPVRAVAVPPRRRWAVPATVAATLGAAALLVVAYRFLPVRTIAPPPVLPESRIEVPAREEKADRDEAAPVPKKQAPVADTRRRDAPAAIPEPVAPPPTPAAPTSGKEAERDDARAVLAPAGAARQEAVANQVAPACRDVFHPYVRLLRYVGPAPDETILSADRFVLSLGGSVVADGPTPAGRDYEVRAGDWPVLRDFLRRAGFATEEEPKIVPSEADCVGVRVDAAPKAP